MKPVKATTQNYGVIYKSQVKITPSIVQNELNRIYYIRSVAKKSARIESEKKIMLVKLRQLKNKIIEKISHLTESIKLK